MTFLSAENKIIQKKLTIGQPTDRFEREANAITDQIMQMPQSPPPIQKRCKDCEEETLQMKGISQNISSISQRQNENEQELQMEPLSKTTVPVIQKQVSAAIPVVQSVSSICPRNRMESAEEIERERIYQDFMRQNGPLHATVRVAIIAAMCHYSLRQLNLMSEAGVRIWFRGSYPPAFNGIVEAEAGGSAAYTPQIRTLFFGRNVNSGYVTHELAHAWDHVRNLPRGSRIRMDNLSERRKLRLIRNPGNLLSETRRRQDVVLGGSRSRRGRISYDIIFQNYKRRLPHIRFAFASSARRSYSLSSVREFYAEGYSVFSGNSALAQARLYKYANELFNVLHNETNAENMPLPNMVEVRREANNLPNAR